jgi:CTP:molybdopterin cytidylyltransferase MocA/HD superfamily phosphodiesterase
MSIAAIILSAGYSSRMGEFKPLLPFGDATVLERDVSLFRDAGIEDVRVVIGHRADDLLPLVHRLQARPVMNERYADGMFSSVRAGVGSLGDEVEAFFLLPVDIPLVRRQTIFLLAEAFSKGPGAILYPAFYGKRGHPPLIASRFREEILAWSGEGGLKSFLSRHDSEAVSIETEDESILLDMDTLAEYDRLRAAWRRNAIPSAEECEKLLAKKFVAEMPLVEHCRKVAKLAVFLAKQLNEAGCRLDTGLIEAAALLHDLAKGKPNHASEGGRILDEMGYPDIARVVAAHMDITVVKEEPVCAAEVLYLADKMTLRDRYVAVEERFESRLKALGARPDILDAVAVRRENALLIRRKIEDRIGSSLTEVMKENGFR